VFNGGAKAEPDAEAPEKNFSGRKTPKQCSQRSQCSHDGEEAGPEGGADRSVATCHTSAGEEIEPVPENSGEGADLAVSMDAGAFDPQADALGNAVRTAEEAIAACGENPGVLASEKFRDACRLLRENDQEEWLRLRVSIKKAKPSGVLLGDIDKATRPESEAVDDSTIADQLVEMVLRRAELFHAPDGSAFATTEDGGVSKTFKIGTAAFDDWISYSFYKVSGEERGGRGTAAGESAIRTATTALSGISKHDGPERQAFLRCAPWLCGYLIDLGDDSGRVVEALPTGWRILEKTPLPFWRPNPMRALPMPVPGGDLARLWEFASVPEKVRPLVLAAMLESFRPDTGFPVLELIGTQGTGKSSSQEILRKLIDPSAVNLRAAPKSVEDVFVGAGCNWLVSFNNLSHLSAQMQDALCSLATGGGFAARTLYTNADETLIECKRAVIINGIAPLVTAQDLIDRTIHIELEPIPTYRDEAELNAAFDEAAPGIFGGLLDLFVRTLAKLPDVRPERWPRMAAFAKLGEAMMQATGHEPGEFLALYAENRRDSIARGLDASPVASAVRALVEAHAGMASLVFTGSMKRLLGALEPHRQGAEAWPKSPRGLGDALRRQAPGLTAVGIRIDIGKPGRDGVPVSVRREHCERGERRLGVFLPEKFFSGDSTGVEGGI
jgi:hypothetical protein